MHLKILSAKWWPVCVKMGPSSSSYLLISDDSWLTISQADLDKMLEEASGKGSSRFNFSVAQSMRAFISKISSHEGAEMPK